MKKILPFVIALLLFGCQSNEIVTPNNSSNRFSTIRKPNDAQARTSCPTKIIDRGFVVSTRANHPVEHNWIYEQFPDIQAVLSLESNGYLIGWEGTPPVGEGIITFYKKLCEEAEPVDAVMAVDGSDGISYRTPRRNYTSDYIVDFQKSDSSRSSPSDSYMPSLSDLISSLFDWGN